MSDELPAVAEARMAEIRRSGTWGSALTSDEFAAIRSVGFEAVGQVLGACVYNIGYTGGYNCPGAWGSWGYIPARTTTPCAPIRLTSALSCVLASCRASLTSSV